MANIERSEIGLARHDATIRLLHKDETRLYGILRAIGEIETSEETIYPHQRVVFADIKLLTRISGLSSTEVDELVEFGRETGRMMFD
jgi:hypothetical protein